ncbi:MAG: branched-chain amino acid ABC transporter permease [Dehalococcoidales bacterium]|nr:branched-chain amino acid ABC transporter permease [Dehalococcoidales bacterium]
MTRRKLIKTIIFGALLVFFFTLPLWITQSYYIHILILIGINIVLASSLRFIAISGQLSLAHSGMISLGAYCSALLAIKMGYSFWMTLPVSGIFTLIMAFLVGYPFARLKGFYFTMVSLFFTIIVMLIGQQWKSLTGGTAGLTNVPRPDPVSIYGLVSLDFSSRVDYYYLILVITILSLLVLFALEFSRLGRTLKSIKQDDQLAESVGVNTYRFRIIVFGLGSLFAGVIGSFYAHYITAMTPSSFNYLLSINLLIYVVFGGMGSFAGPVLGAFILTIVPELFRSIKQYEPFIFAGLLLIIIMFLPEGLISLLKHPRTIFRKEAVRAGSQ